MVLSPVDSLALPIEALVLRFCKANQGFGKRRLLPDDGEAIRVQLSCRPGSRALELE